MKSQKGEKPDVDPEDPVNVIVVVLFIETKSCPTLATPRTVAHQPVLFMEFSRQEYWSGLPFPSPGDLLNPGIEPGSPAMQADSLPLSHQGCLSQSIITQDKRVGV